MWFFLRDFFFLCPICCCCSGTTHGLDPPRLSPSSPSTLRATAAFRGFRRRRGCNLCHLTPEMAHSRRANHRSSKLGPIFCKRRGLGVLSLKYVKWLQYVCAYCIVYSMVLKWCIIMHYDASLHYDVLLWCIMIHYDSLRLMMIHCDSSAADVFFCRFANDISIYRLGCPPAQHANHHPDYYIF